jgi:hypothetical protein
MARQPSGASPLREFNRSHAIAGIFELPPTGCDPGYKITKAQLEYLAQRVRKLQRLTKKICQARIESYLSARRNPPLRENLKCADVLPLSDECFWVYRFGATDVFLFYRSLSRHIISSPSRGIGLRRGATRAPWQCQTARGRRLRVPTLL